MEAVAPRLEKVRRRAASRIRIALNFGPNKDTPVEQVAADYATLMARLAPLADFVVINVSSPNTPGLRNWQSPERMREIFAAMEQVPPTRDGPPILLKVAPDLETQRSDRYLRYRAGAASRWNGRVQHDSEARRSRREFLAHGRAQRTSFARLARATASRRLYAHPQGKLPIIGVGGIMNADDALGHIKAGASLVELYTGLIYEGPGLVASMKKGLANLLRREGFRSISEAVGATDRGISEAIAQQNWRIAGKSNLLVDARWLRSIGATPAW